MEMLGNYEQDKHQYFYSMSVSYSSEEPASLSVLTSLLSPSLPLLMSSWSTWEEAAVGGDYSSETPK